MQCCQAEIKLYYIIKFSLLDSIAANQNVGVSLKELVTKQLVTKELVQNS